MHILGGLLLLVVVFGGFYFIYQADVFDSLGLEGILSGVGGNSTSTANNSRNYQDVRIQFVSLGNGSSQPMAVSLEGTPSGEEGVNISGWSLRTNAGTYTIPRTVNLYSPSVEGVPPEDIYLRQGGEVIIYSGRNPQSGQPQAIRSGLDEWRIYLDKNFLSAPHGVITLRDDNGKAVDRYEY